MLPESAVWIGRATESGHKVCSSGKIEYWFWTTWRRETQIGRAESWEGRTGVTGESGEAGKAAVKSSRVEALILSRLGGFIRSPIRSMSTFRPIRRLISWRWQIKWRLHPKWMQPIFRGGSHTAYQLIHASQSFQDDYRMRKIWMRSRVELKFADYDHSTPRPI